MQGKLYWFTGFGLGRPLSESFSFRWVLYIWQHFSFGLHFQKRLTTNQFWITFSQHFSFGGVLYISECLPFLQSIWLFLHLAGQPASFLLQVWIPFQMLNVSTKLQTINDKQHLTNILSIWQAIQSPYKQDHPINNKIYPSTSKQKQKFNWIIFQKCGES
jgi:hypothetical protein